MTRREEGMVAALEAGFVGRNKLLDRLMQPRIQRVRIGQRF